MTDTEIIRGKTLKVGDTKPSLRIKLLEDGDPFNLDGYTVTILAKLPQGDSLTVDELATIESTSRGIVTYDWSNGETDTSGTYELEIVANDGTDEITFPNQGTATLYIEDRLR